MQLDKRTLNLAAASLSTLAAVIGLGSACGVHILEKSGLAA